jgi:hypothetical protein
MRAVPVGWFVACVLLASAPSGLAQAGSSSSSTDERERDADPTRPVFFSIRPEFYARNDVSTQFSLIFRYDTALFAKSRAAAILRAELPVSGARAGGEVNGGIGDAYVQVLVPWSATRTFVLASGSGVALPTASDDLLGARRWTIAPVVAPVWRLRRGLTVVKFQNFVTAGGDEWRHGANYLLITPTFLHLIGRRWWLLVDAETKTDWRSGGRTGIKSGTQIGLVARPGLGLSIKPEVWWGPNRDGQWNLKLGLVWYEKKSR